MKQPVIALCGVHGSGKSTLVAKLLDHYLANGKSVWVVNESARDCPFPLGTVKAQRNIWYTHQSRERSAFVSGADRILTDRTVMDNLCYLRDIIEHADDLTGAESYIFFHAVAKSQMKRYSHIVRLPLNLEYLKADDPLRPKSVEYAKRIDKLFDDMVEPYVNSTVEELFAL